MRLITGYMPARAIFVAAELGIADLLADGAKTSDVLARETNSHVPSLHRLLRALASIGVVSEGEGGRFALTERGAHLRSNVPGSVRNQALLFGGERSWRSWGDLLHSVQTGEPAVRHVFGVGSFEYFAEHPDQGAIFNAAMAEITRKVADALVSAYDFSRHRQVIDIGGGNGAMIAAIATASPQTRGVVFDQESVCAQASRRFAEASLTAQCDVIAGDFFREIPKGGDAYILKSVIHDWDDEASIAILRNCHAAMRDDSQLLLVERVMPERLECLSQHQRMAMLDINMLAIPGGQERTEAEYRALLAAAGFTLTRIRALPDLDVSLMEADPKPE